MDFTKNELWVFLEKVKHQLRNNGCQTLANDAYKRQLLLESQLIRDNQCKKK